MKPRNMIVDYDHYLFAAFMLLMIFGLIMQLNISSVRSSMEFFYRQIIWVVLSLVSLWIGFKKVNLEKVRKFIFPIVIFTLILLILVLILGTPIKGSIRSFRIWKLNFQPSILARLVLIFYIVHILDKYQEYIPESRPRVFLRHFNSILVIPCIFFCLIFLEKHFTPLIVASLTLLSLLFLARIRLSTISLLIVLVISFSILALNMGTEYRTRRMEIFKKYSLFNKQNDANTIKGGSDYQVRESLISLASGKFFGTTPAKGTGKHYFLPEAKTDYIYAIIGEEYGFLGAIAVLALFGYILFRSFVNAQKTSSLYLQLLSYGIGLNIFINAMINIGVAISALPPTGVTLPFISYGGTSLVINSFSIGLLLNISAEKRTL